jgi:hypothetical protein
MKGLISVLFVSSLIIFASCGKDKTTPDVKKLIIGKWKLTKFKQDNQPWKDSTGTFYNFNNDTSVNTKVFTFSCDRGYILNESLEGIKGVQMLPNFSCYFQTWWSFSVVSIDNFKMEITYPDDVGGVIVRKNEKYIRE